MNESITLQHVYQSSLSSLNSQQTVSVPRVASFTSHNKDGKGVFVVDDLMWAIITGSWLRVWVSAIIIYSTAENPVDTNDDKDMFPMREITR